jgi:hypothetical protein
LLIYTFIQEVSNSLDDQRPSDRSMKADSIPDLSTFPMLDIISSLDSRCEPDTSDAEVFLGGKKKYKPVHLKVRPVKADLPQHYRIVHNITGDPLAEMPNIDFANIPDYISTGRYTEERHDHTDKLHSGDFLWPEERRLLHHFMSLHNNAFAWDNSKQGRFKEEFFPPIEFPVLPHVPWVEKNINIARGIYKEVCDVIKKKIDAGVYEPSNATYRSRWFPVAKKDGKSLRPVHSLEPLNRVTIQHSGVPPIPDQLAETFGGRACGGILDLYVGYNN